MNRYYNVCIATAVALAVSVAAANSGATVLDAIDRLTVVDAEGTTVGRALVLKGLNATVALRIDGQVVGLDVFRDFFLGTLDSDLLFESSDCSGPAFIRQEDAMASLPAPSFVFAPGRTIYIPDAEAEVRTITVRSSSWRSIRDPYACGPWHEDPGVLVRPMRPTIDLNTVFTPPFRLVTNTPGSAGCCGDCDGDGGVTITELVTAVNHALRECPVSE